MTTDAAAGRLDSWATLDLKAEGDELGVIEGYASRFGEIDRGKDMVVAGAFRKSLREREAKRIPMLYGHNQGALPVGVWTKLEENNTGLFVRGRLAIGSEQGKQLYEVLKAGAEFGISIGYRTARWEFDEAKGVRKLIEVDLFEISLVPMPMLDSARVSKVKAEDELSPWLHVIHAARTATEHLELITDIERAERSLRG